MIIAVSAVEGFEIRASDGRVGAVSDFLFDDRTWKLRWMVVDTGAWLPGRKVLVHPSAIASSDYGMRELSVRLTREQVKSGPDIRQDAPVSWQLQNEVYDFYGWDATWGGGNYLGGYGSGLLDRLSDRPDPTEGELLEADRREPKIADADPHLRSVSAVTGYHINATDGSIGHIENFMVETDNWGIRYLIVDTKNWWPGQHVLLSPYAVRNIDWADREVSLDVSRSQVLASPPWKPLDMIDRYYEERLHSHYGWPGYGW